MPVDVTLPPDLEAFVRSQIESGRFASESEVVCAALRWMALDAPTREAELQDLRDAIQAGYDSGDPMPFDLEAIIAEGKRQLAGERDA